MSNLLTVKVEVFSKQWRGRRGVRIAESVCFRKTNETNPHLMQIKGTNKQ